VSLNEIALMCLWCIFVVLKHTTLRTKVKQLQEAVQSLQRADKERVSDACMLVENHRSGM